MSDIVELGRRITVAFNTIAAELDRLPAAGSEDATEALRSELEAERRARQDAEVRAKAAEGAAESRQAELDEALAAANAGGDVEAELVRLKQTLEERTLQAEQLKRRTDELQAEIADLRSKRAEAASETDQINQALVAEIEALRSARETDRAEMDEILGALKPLLSEAENA